MALINKFLKNKFEEPYILVCSSKSQMLFSKDLLDKEGIENDLIPTPKGFGGVCTTAIKFDKKFEQKVKEIIKKNNIEYEGIYSLKDKYKYDLTEIFNMNISDTFKDIVKKIEANIELSKEEIKYLLEVENEEYNALIRVADIIRKECVGDRIEIRAAIEFSNYCRKNCNYCGVRRDNKINRYRMTEEEIINEVEKLYKIGIKTVILQSGEDPYYTTDMLLSIIKKIKQKFRMGITLSVGERDEEEYRLFGDAGVNNYLLKIETASRRLFELIHPDDDYDVRVKHTKLIKEAGMRAGSGGMIGLPTQTIDEIAEDIIFQRDFGIHMIGFGPFLPAKGTPYENYKPGDLELTLKVVAVTRIVCQHVFLPATTAIATLHPDGQTLALKAGANTIMLISTPAMLRDNYQIYSNKNMVDLSFAIKSTRDAKRKLPKYLNYDYLRELGYEIEDELIC
ncbi:[FeFe] hydrogenase H-cluster radical SAM maturase HydE [Caloranaerobacter sp. TR13]|uniref:[FeFe] hydrogenase H-cluster radical SAM maturase HydE n=1 Tax=Caloranaerobacter sp. TR13 TaxID=1302151 RepID=UPI0006D40D61|nr:[FeFe] hydrogenase H-cluster radical SAM maturase HydE [Caloranaerobacter sp. TR13]